MQYEHIAFLNHLQAQSELILPTSFVISSLPALTHAITGFFIIEREVIQTTRNFRSERDLEELWVNVTSRLSSAIEEALRLETDPEVFLHVKENLLAFILTLEVRIVSAMWP